MTITVKLDLGDIAFRLAEMSSQERVNETLMGLAESARLRWVKLAQGALHTSRQAYVLGIQQPSLEAPGVAIVELVGDLPNMIEQGRGPFSLQAGLLNSGRAKTAKDGSRYSIVPYRISGPGTRGAVGQPVDQIYGPPIPGSVSRRTDYSKDAGVQHQAISAAVRMKRLRKGQSLRNVDLPLLQPHHAVNPLEGLMKLGVKGHARYIAFRTVSSNHPEKWQHPGFTARNFATQVAHHIASVGPEAFRALAREFARQTRQEQP